MFMLNAGPRQAPTIARDKSGHEIINCSRETALTCWPRMPLAEALALS
jgi:hypothetical protein